MLVGGYTSLANSAFIWVQMLPLSFCFNIEFKENLFFFVQCLIFICLRKINS